MDEKQKNWLSLGIVAIAGLAIVGIVWPGVFGEIWNLILERPIIAIAIGAIIIGEYEYQKTAPTRYFNKGVEASANGDYVAALKLYEKSISLNEKNADAWNNKSYVLTQLGRYDEAIDAAEKALEISPGDIDTHHTLEEAIAAKKKRVC